ncbi:MAG: GDSL-type esterase/lipase family protein [Oscillospiraceae bacterium]|nr:GDSL-type esterase/lipase family protein [Oscillospiraceae bacterium]
MKMVKKLICALMCVTLMWLSSSIAYAETTEDELVVLGDSIAAGYGIENPEDTYGYLVSSERDFMLSNYAVSGDTTTDLLQLIEKNRQVKNHLKTAETVVISIGGNDFLHLGYESSITELAEIISSGKDSKIIQNLLKTVKSNIRTIHESIRELNPKAKIVLQTVYNPFLGQSDKLTQLLNQLVELFRQDYIDIYNDEADTDANMVIADVEKCFREYYEKTKNTSLVQSDFIHPSVKGHRMIADQVEIAMDDVHRAEWSTVEKSANALVRLAERMFE